MPSTTSNTSSQTPSVNSRQPNNPTKQHLPWSGNVSTLLPPLLPATSPTSHLLLAACRLTLVLAIAAQHLVSHPALINPPPTVQTKQKSKHYLLKLFKYNSCHTKATTLGNG
jgi:hypothetical protein